MNLCKKCKLIFDEPEYSDEPQAPFYYGGGTYVCPYCGSREWEEATECDTCKEYFIPLAYEDTCDKCVARRIREQFSGGWY